MAKLFISFLGTGNYIACNYAFGESSACNVRFIQEAIAKIICQDWGEKDHIRIFCTEKAKETNWVDTDKQGLKSRLRGLDIKADIQMVPIPEGRNETEIMDIFNQIYDTISLEDEIVFDITHSFRSIPLLATSVIQYARAIKNISLSGIYYGAFESLGTPKEALERPIEDRTAPIFNLTPYAHIMDWSYATSDFLKTGETAGLDSLVNEYIKPDLARTKGKDNNANALRSIVNKLDNANSSIKFNRGPDIFSKLDNIDAEIDMLSTEKILPPLKNLLEKMQQKVKPFSKDNSYNLIQASSRALDHRLIPQCVTILQEGLITALCDHFGMEHNNTKQRELITQAIKIRSDKIKYEDWNPPAKDNQDKVNEIMDFIGELGDDFEKEFKNLTNIRNDINHCGFSSNPSGAKTIEKEIARILDIMSVKWATILNNDKK